MQEPADLTVLINRMGDGDEEARRVVIERLYPDFLRLARSVRRWHAGPKGATQTTELVSDAVLRMMPLRREWNDHRHFLASFCEAVRSARVDAQRKRGARAEAQSAMEREWEPWVEAGDGLRFDVLELEFQLRQLESIDPVAADILTMHVYGQLPFAAIAEELGLPLIKVRRIWGAARERLRRTLGDERRDG